MMRVALNGYGRIGRNILRALYENGYRDKIQIVAINDLGHLELNAHLTKYDSIHGRFDGDIEYKGDYMTVNGDFIKLFSETHVNKLPWKNLSIDIVFECSGCMTTKASASDHLISGAKRVLISAPVADSDATIVYGVNDHILSNKCLIVSNASCTTNCLAPVVKVLHDGLGLEQGAMTTIHAFTNDQKLHDSSDSNAYRARAATASMIPTKTGAAEAIGLVLPELDGRLQGMAVRVPTINVSLIDFHCLSKRETSVNEVNRLFKNAAETYMQDILCYNDLPLVSTDFNHHSASAIVDAVQTSVAGKWVKVMAWYDNEWGYSNRMLDTSLRMQPYL